MSPRRRALVAIAVVVLLPVLVVGAAIAIAQSAWAERWLERKIGERIGREVELADIDIDLGWPPAVHLRRLRIGNPTWAKTKDLVDAERLTARVEVPPLFRRRVVVPYLGAMRATAGLERDGERATWRFGKGDSGESALVLGRVFLNDGQIAYLDAEERTALDIGVKGSLGENGELVVNAAGRYKGENAKGSARLPGLQPSPTTPLRLIANAGIGRTKVAADGTVAADLDALDLKLDLAGATLRDLRALFGTNLPDTPPYRIAGQLKHAGNEWTLDGFNGVVGDSDLGGTATFVTGGKRPRFSANLRSKLLDLDDLGPAVGTPPKTTAGETASAEQKKKAAEAAQRDRVLPTQRFSTAGWNRMDADVKLEAKRVQRPETLPIDALSMHLKLEDSLMRIEPLAFRIAGGRVSGPVVIDAREKPARGSLNLEVQGLDLGKLFPTLDTTKQSVGTMYGRAKLAGSGDSIAAMLGSSDGQITLAIDGGRFSLLLVELLGIDIAEAVSLLGTRNRQVLLRCAVGDLAVKNGVATPQTFVIDTTDTVVAVTGTIDFRNETLDLVFRAEPKDPSIFVLRSPIHLTGSFRDPKVRPEAGPIVARVAAAALLAAVNPVLALIPFVETGPGKDSDCAQLVAAARQKGATKKPS